MDLKISTIDGNSAGSVSLSESIFSLTPREDILQRVVCWQLARRQQGSHQAQNRKTIARTGSKMYKQKGTGRARHSSARAPQFRGGGKAHGPVSRSHEYKLPKKIRALGLKYALSLKLKNNLLFVLDAFDISEGKTTLLTKKLEKLGFDNALFIDGNKENNNFSLALANIPNVDLLPTQGLNVYDILRRDKLVLSKVAVEMIEERLK